MTQRTTVVTLPLELRVIETDHTYPVKDDIWSNWYTFGLRAFERLRDELKQEGRPITSFATTGTSNGIDAIAASLVFENLQEVALIDLDERVVPVAKQNYLRYFSGKNVSAFAGSLLEPLVEKGITADLIYANLPILPNGGDLIQGYRRSSRYEKGLFAQAKTEDWIKNYLLEPYYALLLQAKDVLTPRGSVICSIGGRIPYSVIEQVIEKAGFKTQKLLTGFKVQTEPWEVLPGCADAEKDGVTFDFYRYDEAVAALRNHRLSSGKILEEPFMDLNKEELKKIIEPYKITAKQAHEMYLKNNYAKIGHVVHIVRAMKKD
ncbi:TPA: hypothetical protein HA246_06285 [Candidatus Woesearchaeota archaeon]|nr:hypothetical protein [Candidatus Woesearchaeota archaeon]